MATVIAMPSSRGTSFDPISPCARARTAICIVNSYGHLMALASPPNSGGGKMVCIAWVATVGGGGPLGGPHTKRHCLR